MLLCSKLAVKRSVRVFDHNTVLVWMAYSIKRFTIIHSQFPATADASFDSKLLPIKSKPEDKVIHSQRLDEETAGGY